MKQSVLQSVTLSLALYPATQACQNPFLLGLDGREQWRTWRRAVLSAHEAVLYFWKCRNQSHDSTEIWVGRRTPAELMDSGSTYIPNHRQLKKNGNNMGLVVVESQPHQNTTKIFPGCLMVWSMCLIPTCTSMAEPGDRVRSSSGETEMFSSGRVFRENNMQKSKWTDQLVCGHNSHSKGTDTVLTH